MDSSWIKIWSICNGIMIFCLLIYILHNVRENRRIDTEDIKKLIKNWLSAEIGLTITIFGAGVLMAIVDIFCNKK